MKESTVEKGNKLEKEFAEYIKKELGYTKYRTKFHVKGDANNKGCEVDVIAEKPNQKGVRLAKIAVAYYVLFSAILLIGIFVPISNEIGNFLIGVGLLGFIATFIIALNSRKHDIEAAWCECKNLKTKANINQIHKLLREYNDYVATGDKELKEIKLFFVSTTGYIENALKLALSHGIVCFEKDEKVNLYNLNFGTNGIKGNRR